VHKLHEKWLEGCYRVEMCKDSSRNVQHLRYNASTKCNNSPLKTPRSAPECPSPSIREDPARDLVELPAHEVNPPAHRTQGRIGLAFEIDVPPLLAALQLPMCLP